MSVVWVIDWWERGYSGRSYRDAQAFTTRREALYNLRRGADPGWSGRLYRVDLTAPIANVQLVSSVHAPAHGDEVAAQ